jgi:hypothetical protein
MQIKKKKAANTTDSLCLLLDGCLLGLFLDSEDEGSTSSET